MWRPTVRGEMIQRLAGLAVAQAGSGQLEHLQLTVAAIGRPGEPHL